MCDVSGKLIAWMDGELAENEAAVVELHVRDCSACRSHVEAFGEVSRLVATYCDAAAVGARSSGKLPRWIPALAGASAVAALLLFTFRPSTFRPPTVKPAPIVGQVASPAPSRVPKAAARTTTKVKGTTVHRRHESTTQRNSNSDWAFSNPALQIVIPADAMFAPGALPEGTIFRADLSMASDGSVQGLRLLQ
jgi:anti-sigma factor RsiW